MTAAVGVLGLAAAGVAAAGDAYQTLNADNMPVKDHAGTAPQEAKGYLRTMDDAGPSAQPPASSSSPPPATTGAVPATLATPAAPHPSAKGPPKTGPALFRPQPHKGSGNGSATVMRDAVPPAIEKGELGPVMAGDGSGLPYELWKGLDAAAVEGLISTLEIPPRSPALHNLWKRLITSNLTPSSGAGADSKFVALRLEALYRSGLAKDAAFEIASQPVSQLAAADPVITALSARNALAAGNADTACEIARQSASQSASQKGDVPKRLKGQIILMTGYCAAAAKDAASAGLTGELAREEGVEASPGLEALDAISVAAKPKGKVPKQWTLLDYRLMQAAGAAPDRDLLVKAEPALLVSLANDAALPPEARLDAAEAAARLNALSPDDLGQIYRASAPAETGDALLAGGASKGALRRAGLFKAAEIEQTPMKKTRLIRALIDDAKRSGLSFQAMQMLAKAADAVNPQPEIVWFAETGAEIGLASGNTGMTKRWVQLAAAAGGGINPLQHWLALADIADVGFEPHGQHLAEVEGLALHGRFTPDALHRLATVLDALQYNVPIPLWEAASRTPQPNTGFLPATGVLSELQDASKKKEFGRTVLLAMKSLGANGAEGAHMIALGDSIRALKRAGLEADARRLGLEALMAAWPRAAVN